MAINGFPLVMEDTAAYSGYTLDYKQRPVVTALMMGTVYHLVGLWALPVFNCILNAFAWLLLIRCYQLSLSFPLLVGFVMLSLQPLYTSAGLVDAWFFPAVVLVLVGSKDKKLIFVILSGLLLSSHGSGVFLFVPMAVVVLIIMTDRMLAGAFLLAAIVSFGSQFALKQIYHDGSSNLGKAFLASRFIAAEPKLLVEYAKTVDDAGIKAGATFVENFDETQSTTEYGITLWEIWRGTSGQFNLRNLEEKHAEAIVFMGVTDYPIEIIRAIIKDWASYYFGGTFLDFIPELDDKTMTKILPHAFYQSLQWQGFWQQENTKFVITAMRITLYMLALFILSMSFRRITQKTIAQISCFFILIIGNDLFFAIVSGPPDRYHHRSLVFLAVISALLVSRLKSYRSDALDSHCP